MFHDEIILCPSAPGLVKRVLEQQSDGSVLYSCLRPNTECEEIRLFDVPSKRDVLIYVHKNNAEIVNASLNPDRNVVALTAFHKRKHQSCSKVTEPESSDENPCFLEDNQFESLDSLESYTILNEASRWVFSSDQTNAKNKEEISPAQADIVEEQSDKLVKGKYISYIADVHPMTWTKKFDVNRGLFQRVIFTRCNIGRKEKGISFKENRLLFIMHKKSVGLYAILLKEPSRMDSSGGSRKGSFTSCLTPRVEIYSRPKSTMIVPRAFWSQWDPGNQRLFYIVIVRNRHRSGEYNTGPSFQQTLHCIQMGETFLQRRIFSCQIDLGIPEHLIVEKSSAYQVNDMDPTVTCPEINVRVMTLKSGTVCMAWQPFVDDILLYKIAILDKDTTVECHANPKSSGAEESNIIQDESSVTKEDLPCTEQRLAFAACGDNILVFGNHICTHLIAIDCISGDKDSFFQHCHYLSSNSELSILSTFQQLPHPMPEFCLNSVTDEANEQCFVCDPVTKSICAINIDKKKLGARFFSKSTSVENKLALCRFGCIAFREQSSKSTLLKDLLLSLLSNDMILHGDQYIGTLLIHMVANDVYWRCPADTCTFLRSLLPIAVHVDPPDHRDFTLSVNFAVIRGDLESQISQLMKYAEKSRFMWQNMLQAFECGIYTPYELLSVSEELCILREKKQKHLLAEKECLQKRLQMIYQNEITKPSGGHDGEEESVLTCFCSEERDWSQENMMTLTYEKLCDHLKRFLEEENTVVRYIARSFVTAQRRVVNNMITTFSVVTGIDNLDKNLFIPVWGQERRMFQLLKRLYSTCTGNNFPLPNGFQTFLTCLTFRCCLSSHLANTEDQYIEDSDSDASSCSGATQCSIRSLHMYNKKDVDEFAFEFFQFVDSNLIQLTGEFIGRLKEEIPDNNIFGSFVSEVVNRVSCASDSLLEILQAWKHPYASNLSAQIQMQKLSHLRSYKVVRKAKKEPRKSATTGFAPLDTYVGFAIRQGTKYNLDMTSVEDATMQGVIERFGRDNICAIAC